MNWSKKQLKNWKLYELLFLVGSIIAITVCFVVGKEKNVLSFIGSLVGITGVLFTAKGLVSAPFLNMIYGVFYIIVSFYQKYYGEAIIYLALMTPLDIITIISWLKNRNKDNSSTVKINKIHGIEYLYLAIGTAIATVGFYFLLRALNTNQLIISTISLITSAVAAYLMFRRCSYYALGFMLNDIVLIVLWSLVVVDSGIGYLPTVISFCVFLINDTYGFTLWKLEEKKQNKNQNYIENVGNDNIEAKELEEKIDTLDNKE